METPPPIWKTPAFWRERAEEWRGQKPEKHRIHEGICRQLRRIIDNDDEWTEARRFLYNFKPPGNQLYFFPIWDRGARAALCDKIADHLEHENQTQGPSAQA